MHSPLTRRALLRRGGLALLAGATGGLALRDVAAAPTPPELTKWEPETDPDWRRANDAYWAERRSLEAGPPAPEPPPGPVAEPEPAPLPLAGLAVADLALRYTGHPYVSGGETPAGWDCSGFVRWAFAQFGVRLPRTTWQQIRVGEPVSAGVLYPGDLLFFDTERPAPGHVALAIGAGRMVHAVNPGAGTTVAGIWGPYWAPRFYAARRII